MRLVGKRQMIMILVLLGLFLGWPVQGVPAALAEPDLVPLKGTFSGVGATFTGELTHLGAFQGLIDNSAVPPTATWTAANGDLLTNQTTAFEIHFDQPVATNVYRYTQTLEITGGSGRFSQTTGQAIVTGNINIATFAYDGEIEGNMVWVSQAF